MAGEADRDTDSEYHCDDGDEGKRLGLVGQKTAIQFIRHGRQGRQTQPAYDTIVLSNGTQRGVCTVTSPPTTSWCSASSTLRRGPRKSGSLGRGGGRRGRGPDSPSGSASHGDEGESGGVLLGEHPLDSIEMPDLRLVEVV